MKKPHYITRCPECDGEIDCFHSFTIVRYRSKITAYNDNTYEEHSRDKEIIKKNTYHCPVCEERLFSGDGGEDKAVQFLRSGRISK